MLTYPSIIIIAGNGKKVGKTHFASILIRHFSKFFPLAAVKICPHFHEQDSDTVYLVKNERFEIIRETRIDRNKDSSKLLAAGATLAFYLQVEDVNLPEAFEALQQFIPENMPVVYESASLRRLVIPALFFIVTSQEKKDIIPPLQGLRGLEDRWITNSAGSFNCNPSEIQFSGNKWSLI